MNQPTILSQAEKANLFHGLHHTGKLLVLPNIWDPLGALLLESLDFPAVATASASISYSNGFADGEHLSFEEMLSFIRKIVNSVSLPVTADIESGYADNDDLLQAHVLKLLESGIAGINIEDTDKRSHSLLSIEQQAKRIRLIKETVAARGGALFINARTDVNILSAQFSGRSEVINEIIERGEAYKNAGADGFYPITITSETEIRKIVGTVALPVNILAIAGIPGFEVLQQIGVARLSLGPGFLKTAIQAMKKLAVKLKNGQGLEDITGNEISSDYLKQLINKEY